MKKLLAAGIAVVLIAGACGASGPNPTPQIVYVTPAPLPLPTPQIVYVTPAPTATTAPTATPSPTAVPTPSPTAVPTPEPDKPITIKGKGGLNTKPFQVLDGDYTVTLAGNGDGNVALALVPRDKSDWNLLFNEITDAKYKYETIVYGLAAGPYYFEVMADGPWTITMTLYH